VVIANVRRLDRVKSGLLRTNLSEVSIFLREKSDEDLAMIISAALLL
jgi:hypothetical protein